jgi:hypothetical protein
MASVTDRHGTTFHLAVGGGMAFCSHCREAFNSAHAFDKHLKRTKRSSSAKHLDPRSIGMVRNKRGLWTSGLQLPDEREGSGAF